MRLVEGIDMENINDTFWSLIIMKKLLSTSELSRSIIMDKLILAGSGYLGGYIINLILQNQYNFSVKEVC